MSPVPDSLSNLGAKVGRRILSAHKPLVRLMRRGARASEHRRFRAEALAVDRALARVAAGTQPIVAGPWLAEVGYETLYWVPFLRWFADRYAVPRERFIALSRGGVADWYAPFASQYVDLLDLLPPERLSARNRDRQVAQERGGQKQSGLSELDRELLAAAEARIGAGPLNVCHPSMLFQLFRQVWYGNLPLDVLWTRTRYTTVAAETAGPALPSGLPARYTCVKFYSGTALPMTDENVDAVRDIVRRLAASAPVISLDSDFNLDEHRDFHVSDIPNVVSARTWMTPSNNLGIQHRLIAGSTQFVGTCGGLAWLAPFLGVPTTAVFADDQLLGTHLMIARHAGRGAGAAEFTTLDLRAVRRVHPQG